MQLSLKLLNSKPVGPLCNQSKVRQECMPMYPLRLSAKIGQACRNRLCPRRP